MSKNKENKPLKKNEELSLEEHFDKDEFLKDHEDFNLKSYDKDV